MPFGVHDSVGHGARRRAPCLARCSMHERNGGDVRVNAKAIASARPLQPQAAAVRHHRNLRRGTRVNAAAISSVRRRSVTGRARSRANVDSK